MVDITKETELSNSNDHLRFCTIHSFKGLESEVVILTDVEEVNGDSSRLLNYTGISRAKVRLYLFYDQEIEGEVEIIR